MKLSEESDEPNDNSLSLSLSLTHTHTCAHTHTHTHTHARACGDILTICVPFEALHFFKLGRESTKDAKQKLVIFPSIDTTR